MSQPKIKKRRPLPPACDYCRPQGGLWIETEPHRLASGAVLMGLRRCDCPRGRALAMGPKWGKQPKNTPHDGRMKGAGE